MREGGTDRLRPISPNPGSRVYLPGSRAGLDPKAARRAGLAQRKAPADPYASRTIPSYTLLPCTPVPSIGSHATVVLAPGRYCSAINVGGATLQLTPGIYYLDQANLSANNGSVTCPTCVAGVTGVTIILTSSTGSNWSTVNFSGNSTIELTAPPAGPTAGMVFFQDRNTPYSSSTTGAYMWAAPVKL
jgi:hypothetical protein